MNMEINKIIKEEPTCISMKQEPRDEEYLDFEESGAGFTECIKIEEQEIPEIKTTTKLEIEEQALCDVAIKDEILEKYQVDKNPRKRSRKASDPRRDLACDECGFKAVKLHHLVSHIELAHQKDQQPKQTTSDCTCCMCSTKYEGSWKEHMTNFHIDELGKRDSDRKKEKKSSDDAQTHLEAHATLDEDKIYACNYCSYRAENVLMRHHLVIHVIDNKPVKQCPHCPLRFTENVLNCHVQEAHYPDATFGCPECDYVTKFMTNFQRHLRRHVNLEKCLPTQEKKASVVEKKSDQRRKFLCVPKTTQ